MIGRYPSLNAPIAILLGKDDSILDGRAHCEAMKKIRGISSELVSGGHMVPITAAKATAEFIR
jgi:surfactin synthase thioesterase subunit